MKIQHVNHFLSLSTKGIEGASGGWNSMPLTALPEYIRATLTSKCSGQSGW